ncbi:MAG TPA: DNA mismatch repair protein [Syntrophomonas sp.]|nr:DNA mismatch repair protein [Syntrophomonas sp.]
MNKHNPEQEYRIRAEKYAEEWKQANGRYNLVSNLRLAAFAGIIAGVILYYFDYRLGGAALTAGALIAFVLLIALHERVQKQKDLSAALLEVNRQALARISGKWVDFPDNGEEYIDPDHPYSVDLDIFGQASVFQWINHTFTFLGRAFFKNTLLAPAQDITHIKARQDAIGELAEKLDWRQHFVAEGSFIKKRSKNPESLFVWSEKENQLFQRPWLIAGVQLLTAATLVFLLLSIVAGVRYLYIAGPLLLVQFLLFMAGLRLYADAFEVTDLHKDTLVAFRQLLAMIETESFNSAYLTGLQSSLMDEQGRRASQRIDKLSFIVDMMELKHGQIFYFLINVLCLYDYHCVIALEKWKRQSGPRLRDWFTVIGEFEELSSFAVIGYDHPGWRCPQLTAAPQNLTAVQMGHPLLPDQDRVCNNLNLKGGGHVLLITGSNMSGKSTLLRTVGVNLVLAYAGSAVCADDFTCSILDIHTSMRVNDNLEKKISSFYAELLRIKTILQAAAWSSSVLFLLDEIFKGTNSRDRHLGAASVIKKLSQMGAVGLVSTHDLELGDLESDQNFRIENYHFSESYANDQIIFDYKLRPGISKTTNALYLMHMVGIEET